MGRSAKKQAQQAATGRDTADHLQHGRAKVKPSKAMQRQLEARTRKLRRELGL